MKLELVGQKVREENGYTFTRKDYSIVGYAVTVFGITYDDGMETEDIQCTAVKLPGMKNYLPEIYYNRPLKQDEVPRFEIQTTYYGALGAKEFEAFLDAQNTALEVVKTLNREFIEK